jgi:hypothetical protein
VKEETDKKPSRPRTRKQRSSRSLVDDERHAKSLSLRSSLSKHASSRTLVEEEIHSVFKNALDEIYSVLEEAEEATLSRPKPQRPSSSRPLVDDHQIRKSSRPKTRKQLSPRSLVGDKTDLRSPRPKTRWQSSSSSLLAGDKKKNGHSRSPTRPKSRKQHSSRSLYEAEKKVEVSKPMSRKQRSPRSVGMDDTTGVSSRPSSRPRSTKQRSSRSLVDLEKKVKSPTTRKQSSSMSRIDNEEETDVSPLQPKKPSSWKNLLEMDEERGGICRPSSRPQSRKKLSDVSLGTVEDQQSTPISTKQRSSRSLGDADRHRESRKNPKQKASRKSVGRKKQATQSSRPLLTTVVSSGPLSDEDITSSASIPSTNPASSDRTSHADEESEATLNEIIRSQ